MVNERAPLRVVDGPGSGPGTFDAAFREHYPFVHRTLRALGVDAAAVDDAAQEVFLVVHRRLADYDGRVPLRAWIFGIARRVAHDVRRSARRRAARLALAPAPRGVTTPEHDVSQRHALELLQRFLDGLAEDRRAVFVLLELEEMTAPEVAVATGLKLNTVYSHLRKARVALERATAGLRAEARREAGRGTAE